MAKRNFWSNYETLELKVLYNGGFESGDGKLNDFCDKHGRTIQLVCRKASELNLTNRNRVFSSDQNKKISERAKKRISETGHPKGFLGRNHSIDARLKIGEASRKSWGDENSSHNTAENRQRLSDLLSIRHQSGELNAGNSYSRVRSGKIDISGRILFVRSSWEANIAAYLNFKVDAGLIQSWQYENKTFWFLNIMRGVRSYKPDFEITNNDGSIYYIEVKGWMDAKSQTKLKRMAKYYPDVKIELIDQARYKEISKNKFLYKYWGQLDKKNV